MVELLDRVRGNDEENAKAASEELERRDAASAAANQELATVKQDNRKLRCILLAVRRCKQDYITLRPYYSC